MPLRLASPRRAGKGLLVLSRDRLPRGRRSKAVAQRRSTYSDRAAVRIEIDVVALVEPPDVHVAFWMVWGVGDITDLLPQRVQKWAANVAVGPLTIDSDDFRKALLCARSVLQLPHV